MENLDSQSILTQRRRVVTANVAYYRLLFLPSTASSVYSSRRSDGGRGFYVVPSKHLMWMHYKASIIYCDLICACTSARRRVRSAPRCNPRWCAFHSCHINAWAAQEDTRWRPAVKNSRWCVDDACIRTSVDVAKVCMTSWITNKNLMKDLILRRN